MRATPENIGKYQKPPDVAKGFPRMVVIHITYKLNPTL
jgi:hypothetical protein